MSTYASRCCAAVLLLAGSALAAGLWHSTGAEPAAAQEAQEAQEIAELKEQLKNGLLVERPEDQAFIDRVVRMVKEKRLPVELVKSTFQWARLRKKPYPFPYFKRALEIRAGERGIKIDQASTEGG
ncbi:MAG: hypothetical protein KY475_22840 [Planctomycetes bacterium]|nr:hypothetical protein [Planctomycetota bacterium]